MLSQLIKFLKRLPKDPLFKKSVKHFGIFFAVVAVFAILTATPLFSSKPHPQLPSEYQTLESSYDHHMSTVSLEQALRTHSAEVQGLVLFQGMNTIVVLGNGLEHDKVAVGADVDEMRQLAVEAGLPVIDRSAAAPQGFFYRQSAWWYVIALSLLAWLCKMLLAKRERGMVRSRTAAVLSGLPSLIKAVRKATGTKPSHFHLELLITLAVLTCVSFVLPQFHNTQLYTLPAEVASAQHIESWQIRRHLTTHPEEFQRANIISDGRTIYLVLNSKSVPVALPPAPPAPTAPDMAPPMVAYGAYGAVAQPAPSPPPQPVSYTTADHKPTLIERTVVFAGTAEGRAEYAAFVADLKAHKVEYKTEQTLHDTDYFSTVTVTGWIVFGMLLLATSIQGFFVYHMWDEWHRKENPDAPPREVFHPNLVGAGGAVGSSGSVVQTREEDRKTFADVAGCQEAIDELVVVKKKIMRPRLYKIFGAPVPSGVILYGPPGTGKTLLARALAGEVGGSFQALSGSEFVEMYVGVGAKRVREAYTKARTDARKSGRISIIFIDEFDALAKKRSSSSEGGNREYEQTLNQLLVEMNGFGNHGVVLTMAATNRLDILDEAVLRPGRFDIKVKVPKPDRKGRALIFGIYLKKLKLVLQGQGDELKANYEKLLDELARRSHDFSGAEIEGAIKDGATIAVERQFGEVDRDITDEQEEEYRLRAIITPDDLHLGIDKMAYGTQIRSRVRTDSERWATAIHEIAHAAVPTEEGGDPVNRITIVMTDKSLGLMDSAPAEGERYDWTDKQFHLRIRMMLAGRAAEKMSLDKISTGASNDFERASLLARQMVGTYGMTVEFGNKSIPLDQHGFPVSNIGEKMLGKFNKIWGRMIDDRQAETEAFVLKHRAQIEYCAQRLYDDETLTGDEFRRLWVEKREIDEAAAHRPAIETAANAPAVATAEIAATLAETAVVVQGEANGHR